MEQNIRDKRKEKIKELEVNIELASLDLHASKGLYRTESLDKDTTLERRKEILNLLMQKQMIIEALIDELKVTRMNKNSSSAFEYHPSPPNRRMRRAANRRR